MKKVFIVIALFMCTSLISSAQENIKAVIKKCEKASSVEMSYIINKDPETRKIQNSVTTIRIKDDPNLVKEFIAAFEKDKDNAYSVSGSIKNGVSIPSSYRFSDGKDNYISCTISISKDNTGASVSYRESPNKPSNISIFMNGGGEPFSFSLSRFGSSISEQFPEAEKFLEEARKDIEERAKRFNEKKDQIDFEFNK